MALQPQNVYNAQFEVGIGTREGCLRPSVVQGTEECGGGAVGIAALAEASAVWLCAVFGGRQKQQQQQHLTHCLGLAHKNFWPFFKAKNFRSLSMVLFVAAVGTNDFCLISSGRQ